METLISVVDDVLTKLAHVKKMDPSAAPYELVVDSLDQMRILVMFEERLRVIFDDTELRPFDLTSRTALTASVAAMLDTNEAYIKE